MSKDKTVAKAIASRLTRILNAAVKLRAANLWSPPVSAEFMARRAELWSLAKDLKVVNDVMMLVR